MTFWDYVYRAGVFLCFVGFLMFGRNVLKAQKYAGEAMKNMLEMLRLQSDEIVKMEDRIDKLECDRISK